MPGGLGLALREGSPIVQESRAASAGRAFSLGLPTPTCSGSQPNIRPLGKHHHLPVSLTQLSWQLLCNYPSGGFQSS